jgi:L-ascorbate metabolism protein UlaG (beta-lactamase superfamily)
MSQLRWLGHAGFKISFADNKDPTITRNLYIDTWLGNPFLPEDIKGTVPDDADLVLVTHGHFDHSGSAPDILKASKKDGSKIICNYEIESYYKKFHGVAEDRITSMNKGGTVDFGFCTVTMVSADHSSGCLTDHGLVVGGEPAGYVIKAHDFGIYHAGDTNVFGDM